MKASVWSLITVTALLSARTAWAVPVTYDVSGTVHMTTYLGYSGPTYPDNPYDLSGWFTIDSDDVRETLPAGTMLVLGPTASTLRGFSVLSSSFDVAGIHLDTPGSAQIGSGFEPQELFIAGNDLFNPEGVWAYSNNSDGWALTLGQVSCGSNCGFDPTISLFDPSFYVEGFGIDLKVAPRTTTSVPEPTCISLFALGLFGLRAANRKRVVTRV
jgi:hypothetical protein